MFLICDHFEPRHGARDDSQPFERVRTWQKEYARFQERCKAEFGTAPLHTWFYPPHHGVEHLPQLAEMAFDGLGEVELHYHHDNDTAESLRADLRAAIAEYGRWGLLLESGETPRSAFGFVHGDWALGNSGGGRHCGVNDEVSILQDLGCWGDFTMPSANECQTRKINAIYYGVGRPDRPNGHDWGPDARVAAHSPDGLFMMQGPLAVNWRAPGYPRIENGSLTSSNWGRADRIPVWLNCNVHVRGRPDWLFVKLHTHGAIEQDFDALFGERALQMHGMLNEQFNDGARYRLHYVTAREAYNIAKAAERGEQGDPGAWLDYGVGPPATRLYTVNARHRLLCCVSEHLALREIETAPYLQLRTKVGPISGISGPLRSVDIDNRTGVLTIATHDERDVTVEFLSCANPVLDVVGATLIERRRSGEGASVRIRVEGECTLRYGNNL